ncbi:S8 family serine peptidase [Streptomyces albus subsp. chlorinus]|uniref:S8 family serine peptidase n=1 Tax=Streptomyces albus TaxID=1888 RepID=UPI00156E7613|nr:S8 family serine peptidase [Streptomyces albus]NSC24221.1 S8 family serine peptidase [Streptomyces albus subsp. chlorinus]
MTAGIAETNWSTRRRLIAAVLATGALVAVQGGLAPGATAEDARSQQWYLDAMQAEKMWKVSTGKGITVAVLDTGVDPSTKSLRGKVLPGKDFAVAPGDETKDDVGHGTTMAELIAGSGEGGGIRGLAPDAEILPYRLGLFGVKGNKGFTESAQAIRAAADSDAKIINMSFGGTSSDEQDSAIDYAIKKGKLLFAGVGTKKLPLSAPASHPEVVGVTSINAKKVSDFPVSGDDVTLAAPGEGVPGWCDARRASYCKVQGTSVATAIASASAALIWSKHPNWTANQVLRVLTDTAGMEGKKKGLSKYLGYGAVRPRLNLLENKGDPGDPDISPLTGKRTLHTRSASGKASSKANDSDKSGAPDKVEVADSKSEDGDSSSLLPAVGIAAGVVLLAGCGFAVARLRRN